MATLIAVYNSEGCVGRCDAKCYNAESPHCDCICGGRNHGVGKNRAIQNNEEMCAGWLEEFKKRHPELAGQELRMQREELQLDLFGGSS
jgi:hypothetical protein